STLEARGLGAWRAEVDLRDGEQVVLRQAYDRGWRATVDGRSAVVRADPIGQLVVDVPPGRHVVELDHGVHTDLIAGIAVASVTAMLWLAISVRRRLRRIACWRSAPPPTLSDSGRVPVLPPPVSAVRYV